jgi:hypothetical protein
VGGIGVNVKVGVSDGAATGGVLVGVGAGSVGRAQATRKIKQSMKMIEVLFIALILAVFFLEMRVITQEAQAKKKNQPKRLVYVSLAGRAVPLAEYICPWADSNCPF